MAIVDRPPFTLPTALPCLQSQVSLRLNGPAEEDLSLINSLAAGGARIVELFPAAAGAQLQQIPAQSLAHVSKLWLSVHNGWQGWQHLPRQLKDLSFCGLQQLPAELAGLTQLSQIWLEDNPIAGGWQHLP